MLQALSRLYAYLGVFGIGGVDGDDFGQSDGGFAYVGMVDDKFFTGLHAAEVEESLGVGDAVPCGLAVADEVVVGVGGGFGFQEEGHGFRLRSGRVPPP